MYYCYIRTSYRSLINFKEKKMVDKYEQLKKYQLFCEICCFITTLYEFLNEKFEQKELFNDYLQFEIPYSYFRQDFLRKKITLAVLVE